VREAAEPFTSKLFPRETKRLLQTEPLKALVVGTFVRGLSMRDVESLCAEADPSARSRSRAPRGSAASVPRHREPHPATNRLSPVLV
jgi:hypothetical protein